ncbi:hypothetical protein LOTGIDRAFT_168259 [Lottia gigantea]|uniref:Fibrinogen C-terminal domain-containing protein n=1 Tax=Lottia gigantea TaxID=225164 RepID=V3Z315_LOTGI|nr:hypothetical protein LOTGIDRAFT_168259 [Lottia gigantea]ESO84998.1 hypothetical protein LOTGIDRAFT_168259 [Lottia gigantea]
MMMESSINSATILPPYEEEFETVDNLHWSPETANSIYLFWIHQLQASKFRTTKVLYDRCVRTNAISVLIYKSSILCALKCSLNANCRRMMTCTHPDGVECSFYYEGENCATLHPIGCSCFMKAYSKVNNTAICPIGLYGDNCENTIKDCSEGNDKGFGIFNAWVRSYIKPLRLSTAIEVLCEFRYGGFTFFMTRDLGCEDVSFNRKITEYIDGFGDPNADHWLGLIHFKAILDQHSRNRLMVVLIRDDFRENYYDNFSIGAVADGYPIHLGQYDTYSKDNCGDSLTGDVNIEGSPFSAPGSDQTSFNCADTRQGGWWYANDSRCSESYFMGSKGAMLWPTSLGDIQQNVVALRVKPFHK